MNEQTETIEQQEDLPVPSAWAVLFSLKRLLTWPGDVVVGFIIAAQILGWSCRPVWPMVGAAVGSLALITFLQGRFFARHMILGPVCDALGRVALVLCGASLAGGETNFLVFVIAVELGLYAAMNYRIAIEPTDPPRKAGALSWMMTTVTMVTVGPLVCVAFARHGIAAINPWAGLWIAAWAICRSLYFANAMKGWPTPSLLRQVADQLLRGFFLLQALIVTTLLPGAEGAFAFAALFVLFPLYSLLTKWFPGPAWR